VWKGGGGRNKLGKYRRGEEKKERSI
jgi:hypothetical protein